MSLRLTPSAHKKNNVVTNMRGATYRRSVMGAEVAITRELTRQERNALGQDDGRRR